MITGETLLSRILFTTVVAVATLTATLSADAGLLTKKPEAAAQEAVQANMQSVTIWIDASWGFRNQGAANSLNRAHEAFAIHGYRVLSVEPYIENGDLQGFFVTYQKP